MQAFRCSTELFVAVTGDCFGKLAPYDQDGAIYLKAADTPFALMDGQDQRAQIQQTGLFVKEDYSVGTIQKVDYVV